MYLGWKFFPGREGVATGVVITGFGLGGYVFTILSTHWVNPGRVNPQPCLAHQFKSYDWDVAQNLPSMLCKEAIGWMTAVLLAALFISEPPAVDRHADQVTELAKPDPSARRSQEYLQVAGSEPEVTPDAEESSLVAAPEGQRSSEKLKTASLPTLLKTRQFILLYAMNFCTIIPGVFMIGSSKSYAATYIYDEGVLSQAAAWGSIFSTLRFVWSFLLDRYSYKSVYTALILLQLVTGFSLPSILTI